MHQNEEQTQRQDERTQQCKPARTKNHGCEVIPTIKAGSKG